MSTRPIERRHARPFARRGHMRRALTIGVLCAATFAIAFLVGHTHGAGAAAERLSPSLPKVPTPVSAGLLPAPPIELGSLKSSLVTGAGSAAKAPSTTSTQTGTTATTPVTERAAPPTATTPAAPEQTSSRPETAVQPPPTHSSSRAGSSTGKSGTSFESSG